MLKKDAQIVPCAKYGVTENTVLLYKMAKSDPAIVKSILEFNGRI